MNKSEHSRLILGTKNLMHSLRNARRHLPFLRNSFQLFCLCPKRLRLTILCLITLALLIGCTKANADLPPTQSSPDFLIATSQSMLSQTLEVTAFEVKPIREWKLYQVNGMAWAFNGDYFTVAGGNYGADSPDVFMYNIENANAIWSNEALTAWSVAYSPDDLVVAIPRFEGISLFDAMTGQKVEEIENTAFAEKGQNCINSGGIQFSSDGAQIITMNIDIHRGITSIYAWDAIANQCLGVVVEDEGVASNFKLSGNDKFIVLGLSGIGKDYGREVHVWNVETRKKVCRFKGAQPVAFTSNGDLIAAVRVDSSGEVDLWDAKSCQFLDTLPKTAGQVPSSLDFSPDGRLLAIGGSDTFQIWGVAERKLLFESQKLPNIVSVLTFSPDGHFILSKTDRANIDDEATITLWGVTRP